MSFFRKLFGKASLDVTKMKEEKDVSGLGKLLNHRDETLVVKRRIAAKSLGEIGGADAAEQLVAALDDYDLQSVVLEALGKIGEPAIEPFADEIEMLQDASQHAEVVREIRKSLARRNSSGSKLLLAAIGTQGDIQPATSEEDVPVTNILPQPFEWIDIPSGSVILEDASRDGGTSGGQYEVPAFSIAKYPVTVAQYEVFIKDGGYDNSNFWTKSGWKWKEEESITMTKYFEDDLYKKYLRPNHAMVYVSWYEAIAFCVWLSSKITPNFVPRQGEEGFWKDFPGISQEDLNSARIILPTEQQWQRAAQGDDNRIYPWGNEGITSTYANYNNEVGCNTPVTKYPEGVSPYGVMDMIGNAGEWCLTEGGKDSTKFEENSNPRISRGGYWDSGADLARATSRYHDLPFRRDRTNGFRVCRL